MRQRLQQLREWLTPRRRLWMGIALITVTIAVPIVSPGTTVSWLIGPASVFFVGAFMPPTNQK